MEEIEVEIEIYDGPITREIPLDEKLSLVFEEHIEEFEDELWLQLINF